MGIESRIQKNLAHFDNGSVWLGLPLKSVLTEWAETARLTRGSINSRLRSLIQFEQWCLKHGIRMPGENDLQAFFDECRSNGMRSTSISCYYNQLGCVFRYLYKKDLYPDILKNIELDRGEYRERVCLTKDEVHHLMSVPLPARERAMISLMVFCGLRCVEVAELLYGDIHGNRALIRGKGKKEKSTTIFLPNTVIVAIEQWKSISCAPKTDDSFVFTSERYHKAHGFTSCGPEGVSREVKKALMVAFPDKPDLSAHCLRHTAITLALESGMDFFRFAKFARHASPKMTMTYTHDNKRFTDPAANRIESMVCDQMPPDTKTLSKPKTPSKKQDPTDDIDVGKLLKRAILKFLTE